MWKKITTFRERKKVDEIKNIEKAFDICADKLTYLPKKYKQWRNTLQNYRNQWSFMNDLEIIEAVAEQEMALDYLWSLHKWLQPKLVLEDSHKLIFIHSLVSIYEAIFIDLLKYKIKGNRQEEFLCTISEHFNKENFNSLVCIMHKAEIISDGWRNYLIDLSQIRNFTHLSKRNYSGRGKLKKHTLFQKSLTCLKEDLINFRNFIKKKYN
jgi:hypothetical protein